MQQVMLTKIQTLLDFLSKEPYLAQLVPFLSENVCPENELATVYVGRLDENGNINCIQAYGYSTGENVTKAKIHIDEDRPIAESLRLNRILLLKEENTKKYGAFKQLDPSQSWESAALIPIGMGTLFGFNFVKDVTRIEGINQYLKCLQSLLGFFEINQSNTLLTRRFRDPAKDSNQLSLRQEKILALIRQNKTNAQIANAIGFSESLVKQETMIIYRKLGVEGRNELIAQP